MFACPRSRLRIWSRETGSAVLSRATLVILHIRAESDAYYTTRTRASLEFIGSRNCVLMPSTAESSPAQSQYRSQGSSSDGCYICITMDQLKCASLFLTVVSCTSYDLPQVNENSSQPCFTSTRPESDAYYTTRTRASLEFIGSRNCVLMPSTAESSPAQSQYRSQGSSSDGCYICITMDQLKCASLFLTVVSCTSYDLPQVNENSSQPCFTSTRPLRCQK